MYSKLLKLALNIKRMVLTCGGPFAQGRGATDQNSCGLLSFHLLPSESVHLGRGIPATLRHTLTSVCVQVSHSLTGMSNSGSCLGREGFERCLLSSFIRVSTPTLG